ncbi:DNA polymerase beta domain protein region [Pyrolobus fumarii 1A]|uniref:DNA polymerase beta domain protein region n=1 Tax=Pyrolobus fumarii (strain DSM 11204 / 1A) TaxID=694429 RepID=G0EG85_PYRF1|nr:nucleotidyltransferase domain-containing protein [Pyrolobus fumarii]AEM38333.1 DNA polymerase beta domain protein region [Pyrolobus fumarii 1A]
MLWARHHVEYLRRWREAAEAIARAVESLGLRARVYVIGGAAEGRLTVLSDVDVLLCLEEDADPRLVKHAVLKEAFDKHGLPIDYPVELHVHSDEECREMLARYRHVRVDPGVDG